MLTPLETLTVVLAFLAAFSVLFLVLIALSWLLEKYFPLEDVE